MKLIKFALLVIVFGLFLRLWQFGAVPHGVNRDEAALGYNAYSILKTGQDEHGVWFPWQLQSFGDWKKPLYVYLSIIPIAIGGLNEVTTRAASLIFSALLMLYAVKLLSLLVSQSHRLKSAVVFIAILMAVNPWHFFFSRIASETLVGTALFVMAVYYLLTKKFTVAGWLFTLTLFTYHAFLLTVPLFLLAYFIINGRKAVSRWLLAGLITVVLALCFLAYATFFGPEKVKGQGLMIYDLPISTQLDIMARRTDRFSILIHNKYLYIGKLFFKNYAASFSTDFLLSGGVINQSYQTGASGYFYPLELTLAVVGFLAGWRILPKKKYLLLVGWLLLAPIPAALTFEAVHATREFLLLPIILIFASLGAAWLVSTQVHRALTFSLLSLFMVSSALPFLHNYFTHYPVDSDHVYHGYLKDVMADVEHQRQSGRYNQVVVTFFHESPYIFYAFYQKLDPRLFLSTVEYYPPDFEGFVHVRSLNGIIFEEVDEEAIALKIVPRLDDLVYSRPDSLEYWIKPLKVWDNHQGEKEIVSWEENQI